MKYLLYLSFFNPFHAHLDRLLYEIFCTSETSSQVHVHRCKGSLPYCPAIDGPLPQISSKNFAHVLKLMLSRTLFRPVICTKCMNSTSKFFAIGNIKFASLGLSLYLKSIVLYLSRKRFHAKLRSSCLDNTISCYLVSARMELIDIKLSFKLSRFLVTRDYHMQESHRVLKTYSPDFIGMFNGRMLPFRSMLNVATKSLSPPSIIVHERGFEDSSFVFKINEPAHSRACISKVFADKYQNISDGIPYKIAKDWANNFFEGRKSGSNLDCIAPKYSSLALDRESIYATYHKLVVIYLTTPDEVDPYSDEFLLIKNQWNLIPIVCKLLNNSFGASNIRIVIRTHPNFFIRYDAPLYNIKKKVNSLENSISIFNNVFVDLSPGDTSPFLIYKNSFLSVSFASSSLLESEYFGTPSLVDANHIYSHGVSYSYDFKSLLKSDLNLEAMLRPSMINELNAGTPIDPQRVIKFSYLWYYINTFRFDTLKYSNFDKVSAANLSHENSADYNFIKSKHHLDPTSFIISRLNSLTIL